jgi:branched-chain amino acid transport system substrate-binding protein
MKKFWVWIGIAIVVILAVVLIVTQIRRGEKEIKIGAILPLTGDAAIWGQNDKEGMDLAVEEINAAGGIKGIKVRIIYEDSEALPQKAVAAFQKLVNIEKVSVIIGDIASSPTFAIAPLAQQHKVVLLSPGATAPKLSEAGPYFFRIWNSDAEEGEKMADFSYHKLKLRKIAILYINNDYGSGLKDVFSVEFEKRGGKIVAVERFQQNDIDFKTQLYKIKAVNPEAIYLVGYPKEIPLILKQAKEIGLKKQILGSVAFEDPGIVELAKDAAEGVIYPYPIDPDPNEPSVKHFIESFRKKYNKEPGIGANAGYDAVKMIVKAIELSCGFSGEDIRKGLNMIKDYHGASGVMTFDENGDVHKPIGFKIIKNGKFVWFEK